MEGGNWKKKKKNNTNTNNGVEYMMLDKKMKPYNHNKIHDNNNQNNMN